MNYLLIFVLFTLITLYNVHCTLEQCNKQGNSCITENRYTKESNTGSNYLIEIERAKNKYVTCDSTKCNCHISTMKHDLEYFTTGITKTMIDSISSKGTKYQIINHKLYRDKNCMFPSRCSGIEYFILKLLPKLPDMDIIINTRDWPQVSKQHGPKGPVFSFSKTFHYLDIMYPAWAFWEGGPAISLYPTGIGRWDKHRQQLGEIANDTKWDMKSSKAFFRGSRTSSERDPLVLLSREFPDLVDAQYTKNQAWKSDADTLHAPPALEVPFKEHCKYKYLFNFRGVAASFRLKHILLCKSLVFHVGNDWQEFFYPSMKPWIHYIPVDSNITKRELKEMILFFKNHDNLAQEIAENGFNFIWNNLRMRDVTCYWNKLLKTYAKLLKYNIVLDKNLIEIKY